MPRRQLRWPPMLLGTVLFDLDGTVIDTGPLIAESFRHAVRTVLGKTIDDEEMLAYVGGWSLREQMCRLAPDRAQELVEAYRAYNCLLYTSPSPRD